MNKDVHNSITLKEAKRTKEEKYWHVFLGMIRVGKVYIKSSKDCPERNFVSIFINKNYQNRGIGFVALLGVCSAFEGKSLYAEVRKGNKGSQQIFRKVGFKVSHKNAAGEDIMVFKK